MPTFSAVVLDTETTQKIDTPEKPLEVVELAYMNAEPPYEVVSRRYKPLVPSAWGAVAIHHILPEDLADCPPSRDAKKDLPQADYWVGHNIDFDWRALGCPPVRRICTLALSRSLFPDLDSHTLSAMTYYAQGATAKTREKLRNAHSAGADVALCLELFFFLRNQTKASTFEDLWNLSEEARIPRKMSFGKFVGQPISAVDRGYASWYARQPDPDQYVLEAFRRQGLLR